MCVYITIPKRCKFQSLEVYYGNFLLKFSCDILKCTLLNNFHNVLLEKKLASFKDPNCILDAQLGNDFFL